VAGLAAGVLLTSCTGGTDTPDDRVLDLVVSPHPDDELEAWSLIDEDQNALTVFLTMTHGEATVNCDPAEVARNTQVDWGEIAPTPDPQGPGTASCAQARIASWNAFLDSASQVEGELDDAIPTLAELDETDVELAGHPAQVWSSDAGVRIAVDGGDGELTAEQVRDTVEQALELEQVPDLPLRRVIGAAYTNDPPTRGDDAYALYRHPDHWAVREALLDLDLETTDGICVATWPSDPEVDLRAEVDDGTYEAFMGLGDEVAPGDPESVRREGSFQRVYGWLAFPRSFWTPTELPVPDADGQPLVMSRSQAFTCS